MSNNFINSLITHKFDFSDEELLAFYISFVKGIALKFDKDIIQFFFNKETKKFPLFEESIRFFNYNDSMIRSAIRVITLKVYGVQDKELKTYILEKSREYFPLLMKYIVSEFITLDEHLYEKEVLVGQDFIDENVDHLYYLNDLHCLNIAEISDLLRQNFIEIIFTFLLKSLEREDVVEEEKVHLRESLKIENDRLSQSFQTKEDYDSNLKNLENKEDLEVKTEDGKEKKVDNEVKPEDGKLHVKVEVKDHQMKGDLTLEDLHLKDNSKDDVKSETKSEPETPKEDKKDLIIPDVKTSTKIEITRKVVNNNLEQELHSPFCMYLLSQTFQVFYEKQIIEDLSRIILSEKYLKRIYEKISSGNDQYVYMALSILFSVIFNKECPLDALKSANLVPISLLKEEEIGKYYPSDFINSILTCMRRYPLNRIKNFHIILRFFQEFSPTISQDHLKIFKEICIDTCNNVFRYFRHTLNSVQEISTLFEQEYVTFKYFLSIRKDQIINDPLMLVKGLSSDYELARREPRHRNELIKIECHKFIVFTYLYYVFEKKSLEDLEKYFDSIFYKSTKYQPGSDIQIDNREIIKCNIYVQLNNQTVSVPRVIVFDSGFMFIIEASISKPNQGKVKATIPLLNTKTQSNIEHRYTLRVFSEKLSKVGTSIRKIFECILVFENTKQCSLAKLAIDKQIEDTQYKKEKEISELIQTEKFK